MLRLRKKSEDEAQNTGEEHLKNIDDIASNSSSSAPSDSSSDEDSDESLIEHEEAQQETQKSTTLRVIAPEQKFISTGNMKTAPDEALDDFDFEEGNGLDVPLDSKKYDAKDDSLKENDTDGKNTNKQKKLKSHMRRNQQEIECALRMSNLPIHVAASAWNLAPFLVTNLKNDGYDHFFPIQSLVIPDVIATERSAHIRARDICVSAPTGSGKTLAFVLPVLNALSKRRVRRLRALVVLPTRDLASQVYNVFQRYAQGSSLKVGLAIGQTDFLTEQRSLVLDPKRKFSQLNALIAHQLNPNDAHTALLATPMTRKFTATNYKDLNSIPKGGVSAIDILVATPGRLLNHLDRTPGFTLQHLQFLIIDEADRLLNQSYQNWIQKVHQAADFNRIYFPSSSNNCHSESNTSQDLELAKDGLSYNIDPFTFRKNESKTCALLQPVNRAVQLRKFLFSATLTKDPQKLSTLGLIHPKHFDAHHLNVTKGQMSLSNQKGKNKKQNLQYSLPENLKEFSVQCSAQQKPIVLLGLLLQELSSASSKEDNKKKNNIVVVFTVSLDATHRLTRLLQLLWGSAKYGSTNSIAEFSSSLNHKQRSRLLRRCSNGEVSVVICSDGMSRGLDIPTVSTVISYDVPSYAKTYVHRCGRTARAGREGKAICILKPGQVKQFEKMRGLIDQMENVKKVGVRKDDVSGALKVYSACLRRLKEVIEAEKDQTIDTTTALSDDWLVPLQRSMERKTERYSGVKEYHSDTSSSVPSSINSSDSASSSSVPSSDESEEDE